jgi:hypothetical protein
VGGRRGQDKFGLWVLGYTRLGECFGVVKRGLVHRGWWSGKGAGIVLHVATCHSIIRYIRVRGQKNFWNE